MAKGEKKSIETAKKNQSINSKSKDNKHKSSKNITIAKKEVESKKVVESNKDLTSEIICIVVIFLSILLFISLFFGGGGFLGRIFNGVFKGLFGVGAYLLPIISILLCVFMFFSKEKIITYQKVIMGLFAFIMIITFFHTVNFEKISFINYFAYLSYYYKSGSFLNGGVLGAIFGRVFINILGEFFTYILTLGLFTASIILLRGKSVIKSVRGVGVYIGNYTSNMMSKREEKSDTILEEDELSENNEKFEEYEKIGIKSIINNFKEKRHLKKQKNLEEQQKNLKLIQEEKLEKQREFENAEKQELKEKLEEKKLNIFMKEKGNFETSKNISKNKKLIKRNDYLIDGEKKYKEVPKPVYFNLIKDTESVSEVKRISLALDEIGRYVEPRSKTKAKNNNDIKLLKTSEDIPDFLRGKGDLLANIREQNNSNNKSEETVSSNQHITDVKAEKVEEAIDYLHYENKTSNSDRIKSDPKSIRIFDITNMAKTASANLMRSYDEDLKKENINLGIVVDIINNENIDIPPMEDIVQDFGDYFEFESDYYDNLDKFYDFSKNIYNGEDEFEKVDGESDCKEGKYFTITPKSIVIESITPIISEEVEYELDELDNIEKEISNNYEKDIEKIKYTDDLEDNKENILHNDDISKNKKQAEVYNNIEHTSVDKTNDSVQVQDDIKPNIIKPEESRIVTINKAEIEEKEYIFPKLSFLNENPSPENSQNELELLENSKILVKTLKSFNVNAEVLEISKGPSVTRYEVSIEEGVKVSKILGLADNLSLSLAATSIRIEAPIPGKSAVGIEVPNKEVSSVYLSEVICDEKFQNFSSNLSFSLGKDIAGNPIVTDIAKMPHLLVAGATGSGKSVCINTLITSILYKSSPDDVKLIMIDPKVVELSVYNGIPHLLVPVVTEPEKASGALNWAVQEMQERYTLFAATGTRNLVGYNGILEENGGKKLPQIVIIIDELADLMMVSSKEVEASICRLAQLARAAGIHLIIATQRPSVDVITGLIKANIPSRIAFAVSSGTDSRTVLDTTGAEKLLGKGDMLFKSVDMSKPLRIQGAFISDKEVENIVTFIKENNFSEYDEGVIKRIDNISPKDENNSGGQGDYSDELADDVLGFLVRKGKASVSLVQRQFRIGYNRAARIIEDLEERGLISSENGSKQRDVLMDKYEYEEYLNRYNQY